jgi:cobalamin biosynthesis Mg chelatase CobN
MGGRAGGPPQTMNLTTGQSPDTLEVEISYTDTNSNRQVVTKSVPMTTGTTSSLISTSGSQIQNGQFQRQSGSSNNLIIYGIVGIVVVVVLIKYHRRITDFVKKRKKSGK